MRFGVLLCCTVVVVWYANPAAAQAFQAARVVDPPPFVTTPEDANLENILAAVVDNLPATLDALNSIRSRQDGSVTGMIDTLESFLGIAKNVMSSIGDQTGRMPNSQNLDQIQVVLRAFRGFLKELTDAGIVQNTATNVPQVDVPPISLEALAPLLQLFTKADPVSPDPSTEAGSPVSPVNTAPETPEPMASAPASEPKSETFQEPYVDTTVFQDAVAAVPEMVVPVHTHAVIIDHPHYNDPLWKLTPEQRLVYQG